MRMMGEMDEAKSSRTILEENLMLGWRFTTLHMEPEILWDGLGQSALMAQSKSRPVSRDE